MGDVFIIINNIIRQIIDKVNHNYLLLLKFLNYTNK